ncbi:MAG TPA: DUF5955 family protein [Streptomyces sp.]|jgi:hypothetical protein|nr:DUF5955 family protein [Streptomyces sp.]
MAQPAATDQEQDPRVAELLERVERMQLALAAHPARLSDRRAAEEALAALGALARGGAPEVPELRRSLLLVAGAVGSVSALSGALAELRSAVELFGRPVRATVR